ncbi:hypothetical protein ACF0H5_002524 [Mactra antiquata]
MRITIIPIQIYLLYLVCTSLVEYSNCTENNGIVNTITEQINMEKRLRTSFNELFKTYRNDSLFYKDYFMYACEDRCMGGYDNGLVAAFLLAVLSERRFVIHPQHGLPFYNEIYDTQNVEWKMTTDTLYNKSVDLVFKPGREKYRTNTDYQVIKKRLCEIDFELHFTSDVMILSGNEDIIIDLRRHPRTSCKIPWLFQTHVPDFIRLLHNGLFRLKDRTQNMITAELIEKVGDNKLTCFVGYQKNVQLNSVVNYLNSKFGNNYKLYVSSENDYFDGAKLRESSFVKSKLVHFDGRRILEETMKYSKRNVSADQNTLLHVIEVHILKFCEVLILADNTYDLLPSHLRRNDDNLYCYRHGIIFPCIRELISGTFRNKNNIPEPIDMMYFCSKNNTSCITEI